MADTPRKISPAQLAGRYERIHTQLSEQLKTGPKRTAEPIARMATICALLHAKMPHFFWTGFYRLVDGELVVGPYQGPLACALLPAPAGVCWKGINSRATVIVPDVHAFEGHVACDERSQSEIVVPVFGPGGDILAVLDVDSDQPDSFADADRAGLEKIIALINDGELI
jgi:L-methionine (R)-S-oxide reductase